VARTDPPGIQESRKDSLTEEFLSKLLGSGSRGPPDDVVQLIQEYYGSRRETQQEMPI
jgi:hypothetical protein